jgi:glycosyltransferase involved in cell wall biosynthesis
MGLSRPLRIGIDGSAWTDRRGIGRFTRSLLTALARRGDSERYVVFVDARTAAAPDFPDTFEKIVVATGQSPARAASPSSRRPLRDILGMSWAAARQSLDVFFFPSTFSYFPLLRPTRVVLTFHDAIAERYPDLLFANRRFEFFSNVKRWIALRQAHVIMTGSEYARETIVRYLGLPPERIRVILDAPAAIFRPLAQARDPADLLSSCPLRRGSRYLLYVGAFGVQKNLPVLIEAFRRLTVEPRFATLRLLLVGDHGADMYRNAREELQALAVRHGLADRICIPGFVSDDVLVELYNRADLVVLPSLEEGFGLPAFEAAACGIPAVVSENGPAGGLLGPAVWTFPPRDVSALTQALVMLLDDPDRRRMMGQEGVRRASAFTWDRAATELHALFREVAARR